MAPGSHAGWLWVSEKCPRGLSMKVNVEQARVLEARVVSHLLAHGDEVCADCNVGTVTCAPTCLQHRAPQCVTIARIARGTQAHQENNGRKDQRARVIHSLPVSRPALWCAHSLRAISWTLQQLAPPFEDDPQVHWCMSN